MAEPVTPAPQPGPASVSPGYQYGGNPPAVPPPGQPTGGQPGWFKRNSTLLSIIVVTVLVIYGSCGTHHFANDASRATARAMQAGQSGPQLTSKEQTDAVEELNQRAAKLKRDQDKLNARLSHQGSGNAADSASTTDGSRASSGASTPGGSGQLSEIQQILQQIRAERVKQEYAGIWTSPIVAVRVAKEIAPDPTLPPTAPTVASSEGGNAPPPDPNQKQFPYDHSTGPYHVIQRSTVVGATLMNELDGERGGPVVAQVDKDDPVYAKNTNIMLWPEGTIVSGMAERVNSGTAQLLGVSFNRVTMPDGYAMSLETTPGASQQGQDGLTGKVNTHWASKLGWSLAVGAIEGLSSGAIGFGSNSSSSMIFRSSGQDMSQLFEGILNRPVSVKIPAGTRIKIILLEDLSNVPEYDHHQMQPGTL